MILYNLINASADWLSTDWSFLVNRHANLSRWMSPCTQWSSSFKKFSMSFPLLTQNSALNENYAKSCQTMNNHTGASIAAVFQDWLNDNARSHHFVTSLNLISTRCATRWFRFLEAKKKPTPLVNIVSLVVFLCSSFRVYTVSVSTPSSIHLLLIHARNEPWNELPSCTRHRWSWCTKTRCLQAYCINAL